jgi:Ca2+-binding RTX toxin-like protein
MSLILVATDGNDNINGTNNSDVIEALGGNDIINGLGGSDVIDGNAGNDRINAGSGNDVFTGSTGVDRLTGGGGRDTFQFSDDPFSGGSLTRAPNGISYLNKPDILTDYRIGTDKLEFQKQQLDIDRFSFQKGNSSNLSGNNNVLVLLNPFPNAVTAARAIANNNAITSDRGLFVYFNTNLGFARVVFSQDLSDGGAISVLGNLTNQRNAANLGQFSAGDFVLSGNNNVVSGSGGNLPDLGSLGIDLGF